jgi:carbamoyltransferase
MRVIGISPLDKDATVSFLEDGKVVFACGEERLSRVKLQSGFPTLALRLGLERTGWTPASIDEVAYAFLDWQDEAKLIHAAVEEDKKYGSSPAAAARYRQVVSQPRHVDRSVPIPGLESEASEFMPAKTWWKRLAYDRAAANTWLDDRAHRHLFKKWTAHAVEDHHRWSDELRAGLQRFHLEGKPLRRFHHHDTHAANAYFASPFQGEPALAVTLDGYGSGCCGGVYHMGPGRMQVLHRFHFPNSLGIFYEQVTSGLGFKPSRHEGKIVGLAAYGNPALLADVLLERFVVKNGDIRIRAGLNHFFTRALAGHFAKRDVAAAYQFVLEEVTRRAMAYWLEKTALARIVVSGGVHANVKLNQRLREMPGVQSVFVYPNMGDGGCGTGAAMLAFGQKRLPQQGFETVYFGPAFSDTEIQQALDAEGLEFERCNDLEERVAELLAQNMIVGRFNGRMEYGPRALGNRSVLYPAKEPEVNQWLNKQLGRTEFMPFAPACLAEAAPRLFKNLSGCEKTAEFMTITFDCTPEMKDQSPAAVHVDGTARPQLVTPRSNPSFYKILKAYERRTGIPVLINTSFNMHEEPIVCSPQDAVRAFLLGNIDYLAAGPFLVPHPKLMDNVQSRSTSRTHAQEAAMTS